MSATDWDGRFMGLARHLARWSKDRGRKVGCVIISKDGDILSTGFNGFPRGLNDDHDHRHTRPAKYHWTEHAERNAIFNATRIGVSLRGARMYLPWFPCVDCARAIIQAGISELIAFKPDLEDSQWGTSFVVAIEMMEEAGVDVRYLDHK